MRYLFIPLIFILSACIPGRKFDRVSDAYKICRADSVSYSDSLIRTNKQKGELILKVVSLQQDSIQKKQVYDNLQKQYNKLLINGSTEMSEILRRMKQNEEETRRTNNNRSGVIVYKSEIDKALDKLHNELTIKLYGIDKSNIFITKTNFAVKVTVNESFLFTKPSNAISTRGRKVIDVISQLFKERNMFNLHIVKNVPVGNLFGNMNNARTTEIISLMSVLDKNINGLDKHNATVNDEIANINTKHNQLSALDSTLLVKNDSMMIVTNNAKEQANLMAQRVEIGYIDPKTDNENAEKALNNFDAATKEANTITEEHLKVLEMIADNKLALQVQNTIADSILRQRNIKIESLNKTMRDIEAATKTTNAAELNVLTSFIIKQCGSNLGDNKITTERVFCADNTLTTENKWIDIILKPDIENIIGQQKNKNIYD